MTIRGAITRVVDDWAIRRFHKIVYYRRLWASTRWMGTPVWQYPSDLMVKQEIIASVKPDLIVECGTAHGGSTLFYANLLDIMGMGRVISIDIDPQPGIPAHPRITYLRGSTTDPAIIEQVRGAATGNVLVILDSLHACHHVSAEMAAYHSLVTAGSYMIVEDGEMNGHPVYTSFKADQGAGPYEAIQQFLPSHPEFIPDRNCERYLVTHHPCGYLKRVR